ncbi:MAG TPA: response regulator [Thermohalobaculum sp.]|nr:response regulator [Thermohalobaculum sp.]
MQGRSAWIVHVVDDDAAVLESLEALLLVAGFEVATYGSAEEFLERAGDRQGCLLLDVNMPGMSGLELLERLAAEGAGTPVVLLTASRDERLRQRARALGARGFLTKPVTGAVLLAAIADAAAPASGRPAR